MSDKHTIIPKIRKESLDLHRDDYTKILNEFAILSMSENQLNEMSFSRLQDMLGRIRRLIILGDGL